jgi:hypothetical protein
MASRVQTFKQLPWIGGVNTSLDRAMIPVNQLIQAKNVVFDTRGSRKKREGINYDWDDQSNASQNIIGIIDYWYGTSSKTQIMAALSNSKTFYKYSTSGTRTALALDAGATAWGSAITQCSFAILNNLLITAVDGSGNVMRKWNGTTDVFDLGGTPPQASIIREHQGRLWTNDKTNLDRLHYSTTANPEEWNGTGDSGALDIGVGDGDPAGITAIFPTFKGDLFVAKQTKLYRVRGDAPENYEVIPVSSGIGCVSHNAVCVIDQDDIFFISERGVHSLAATNAYGDFEGAFISADIQKTFTDRWSKSRLKFAQAGYVNNLNSALFAVTDTEYASNENKAIWLYNIPLKAWYEWPNVSCQSLAVVTDADKKRAYLGSSTQRIAKTQTGDNYDKNTSGTSVSIPYTIETGIIFPDGDPYSIKAFKKFGLIYNPRGPHTITATITIDNFSAQAISFTETGSTAALDVDFVLDESILDYSVVMAPYTQSLDGYGRGFQLKLEQSGTDEEAEIQGFLIEYESAYQQQETRLGNAT